MRCRGDEVKGEKSFLMLSKKIYIERVIVEI